MVGFLGQKVEGSGFFFFFVGQGYASAVAGDFGIQ